MAKSYDQYCPIAQALDAVGERWSLLIVRELVEEGPQRYTDLLEGLQGCSTNVLAARLRDLEAAGIVTRERLPPPAASTVYVLTDEGLRLRRALAELALWGARRMGRPGPELERGWLSGALRSAIAPLAPSARVAFVIDDDAVSLMDGGVESGVAPGARAVLRGTAEGFYRALVEGELGALEIEGDADALVELAGRLGARPVVDPDPQSVLTASPSA